MRTIVIAALMLAGASASAVAAENTAPEWDPSVNIPGVSEETAAEYDFEVAPHGELKAPVLDDLPDRVIAAAPPVVVMRLRWRPGADGRCNDVELLTSSGFREIDDAAIRACRLEYSTDDDAGEWQDAEIVFRFRATPFTTCSLVPDGPILFVGSGERVQRDAQKHG
jgi:hypothetical protein